MDSVDEQIITKRKELQSLQKITSLTDGLKHQLVELNERVKEMGTNAESVAQLMNNWDSIINNISQASLGLLQYAEGDYEIGPWKDSKKDESEQPDEISSESHGSDENNGNNDKDEDLVPLPETMVRIRVDGNE
ncbi:dad2p [Saccharomyces arboricola H-6]|uniref:DASH complex subunit DAD2 n=1 Tax=Saccharomyces arboricola (strain H-6 / AS 2.3317 / CBS 10644) TaxID=1160507 RepID=J8PZP5_SACAR|nr:dad2p [Saccharomyces arboricola H-6]